MAFQATGAKTKCSRRVHTYGNSISMCRVMDFIISSMHTVREHNHDNSAKPCDYPRLLTLTLLLATINVLCGECRARSDYTYVQSNLALHSPLLYS